MRVSSAGAGNRKTATNVQPTASNTKPVCIPKEHTRPAAIAAVSNDGAVGDTQYVVTCRGSDI
jgi:hypothetical protein